MGNKYISYNHINLQYLQPIYNEHALHANEECHMFAPFVKYSTFSLGGFTWDELIVGGWYQLCCL